MNGKKNRPLIIAHRGAIDIAPENSLQAFRKAIELKADYIEFDVHKSKDGALVVIHNNDILRMLGYSSTIEQMTLKELKNVDIGLGEKIPELKDVINMAKGKVKLLCELKAKISEDVITLLRNENLIKSTIVLSFDMEELKIARKIEPELELGAVITEEFIPELDKKRELIRNVANLKFPYIISRYKNVDINFVNYSHELGLKVFVYPINTKITMKKCVNMGVDGMLVNSISKAKAIFKN
ncbi:MAG: glycerophosphodiester phosphodiesterase [Promethearchaeota archaeon]